MSGWRTLAPNEAAPFERELRREVPAGHVLCGCVARARAHPNDVAFPVDGLDVCILRLTWQIETDPQWPSTQIVDALPAAEDED